MVFHAMSDNIWNIFLNWNCTSKTYALVINYCLEIFYIHINVGYIYQISKVSFRNALRLVFVMYSHTKLWCRPDFHALYRNCFFLDISKQNVYIFIYLHKDAIWKFEINILVNFPNSRIKGLCTIFIFIPRLSQTIHPNIHTFRTKRKTITIFN